MTRLLFGFAVVTVLAAAALSGNAPAPGGDAAPVSARETLFLYADRVRAGDREGATALLVPRLDESNTLMDDEMRRWSAGLLDFVVLDQHVEKDVAIFPIVWTGNTGADAKVLVRREGTWRVCYLPDYKVLAGYKWTDAERAEIRAALAWFYDRDKEFDRRAAAVSAQQGRWSDRAPGPIHSRFETDPEWRRKEGLEAPPPPGPQE